MSSLETSVTLADVFAVVEAKRVPLAPELAGYLSLEIADGTDAGSGDVDPKTVFISEEGTVALVRPKRESIHGDAEASVRSLLLKLLDASGSGTPALTTAARRKPGNGLPALVEELEAALIPVNRAAGRRALARLAREIKRVLLGVGRNASVPPVVKDAPKGGPVRPILRKKAQSSASQAAVRVPTDEAGAAEAGRPSEPAPNERPLRKSEPVIRRTPGAFAPEPTTAKRANELLELASKMEGGSLRDEGSLREDVGGGEAREAPRTNRSRDSSAKAVRAPAAPPSSSPSSPRSPAEPPPSSATELHESPKAQPVAPRAEPDPAAARPVPTPRVPSADPVVFGRDDVDSLLDSFGVSNQHGDKQMARELKAIAGLSPTPPPPDAKTLAELTKDIGGALPKKAAPESDSIEALLALADASRPMPPITANAAPPPLPELDADKPALAPPREGGANLPPSPIFGPPPTAPPSSAPGAPAALRQAVDSSRDVAMLDEPKQKSALKSPAAKAPVATARPAAKASRSGDSRPRAPRTGLAMLAFALFVLAGGTAAIWRFAPHVFTGKKKPAATAPLPLPSAVPPPTCKVALVLTEVPTNAEILLRMGQAPADVERMPVGTRLELVATAEGYAPRRAVLKSDDVWNKGPDGKPRIEVPIQLDASKAKPGAIDPWPPAEPGSQVGGSGAPGTVHVVSNVRGAEVWLLAGLGPQARIDQLRCDGDIDVLLAGPPSLRKRLHVGEAEIAHAAPDAQGNKVLNVSAK